MTSTIKSRAGHSFIVAVVTAFSLGIARLPAAEDPMPPKVTIVELMARLKNPNPAPYIDKNAGPWEARFPKDYDWVGQARALEAWKELHGRFEEALPTLVAHVNDKDYCVTYASGESGAERNMTVGQLCEYLICLNIEPYCRPYFKTHTYQSFLLSFDDSEYRKHPRAIEAWWATRKGKIVAALQLESVQWQIDHFKPAKTFREGLPVPKKDIERIWKELEDLRLQLKSNGKLDDPVSWRDGDEIDFRNFPPPPKR